MVDVFISYSRGDAGIAGVFARTLSAEGYDVWWDQRIPTGMTWREYIPQKISVAKSVVVLWSTNSSGSDWVKEEAGLARDNKKLLPVLIDESPVPFGFKEYECAQLAGWNGLRSDPEWLQLLEGVERLSKVPKSSDVETQRNKRGASFRASKLKALRYGRLKAFAGVIAGLAFVFFAVSYIFGLNRGQFQSSSQSRNWFSSIGSFGGNDLSAAEQSIKSAKAIKVEVDAAALRAEEASNAASRGVLGYQIVPRPLSTWRGESLEIGIVNGTLEFKNGNKATGQFRYDGRLFFGERYIDQTLGVSTFYGKDANIDGQPRYAMGVLLAEDGSKLIGSWNARALKFMGQKIETDGSERIGRFTYKQNRPSNVTAE
jgi:hypothetical protein